MEGRLSPFHALDALRHRYLGLRHGESEANAAGLIVSDPARGVPGYGLTAAGRQGVRAAVVAAGLGPRTVVVASDFARARESAEVAREVLGAGPLRLDPRLRERRFGALEGGANTGYEAVWARDARDPGQREQGVESVLEVLARVGALVADLEAALPPGATVLLVSHGDPLQILETGLLRLDPGTHRARRHWAPGEVRALGLAPR